MKRNCPNPINYSSNIGIVSTIASASQLISQELPSIYHFQYCLGSESPVCSEIKTEGIVRHLPALNLLHAIYFSKRACFPCCQLPLPLSDPAMLLALGVSWWYFIGCCFISGYYFPTRARSRSSLPKSFWMRPKPSIALEAPAEAALVAPMELAVIHA